MSSRLRPSDDFLLIVSIAFIGLAFYFLLFIFIWLKSLVIG